VTSEDERLLLERFEGLRAADVRDGLDANGYHFIGSMTPDDTVACAGRHGGLSRARWMLGPSCGLHARSA
jgi:hypothetical protein